MTSILFVRGREKKGPGNGKAKISDDSIMRAQQLCKFAQPTERGMDCITNEVCKHKAVESCLKPKRDGLIAPIENLENIHLLQDLQQAGRPSKRK